MNRLTENHFSFQCPMNWDDMLPTAQGRFCDKCRKEVFDLTNCTVDEVVALQKQHGSICGSIRVVRAAAVAVSLSTAACEQFGQPRFTGTPLPPPPTSDCKTNEKATQPRSERLGGVVMPDTLKSASPVPTS